MDNFRTERNKGELDFITKPVNFEDLELILEKTIEQEHVNKPAETMIAIKENIYEGYLWMKQFSPGGRGDEILFYKL
jgi:hypothetical protein